MHPDVTGTKEVIKGLDGNDVDVSEVDKGQRNPYHSTLPPSHTREMARCNGL